MKHLRSITLVALILVAVTARAQNSKVATAEFRVSGVCAECEERIEQAALIKGVRSVDWDRYTGILKVIYVPSKVTLEDIHKAVAAVGHDTDLVKAADSVYNALPKCCWYRDGAEVH